MKLERSLLSRLRVNLGILSSLNDDVPLEQWRDFEESSEILYTV